MLLSANVKKTYVLDTNVVLHDPLAVNTSDLEGGGGGVDTTVLLRLVRLVKMVRILRGSATVRRFTHDVFIQRLEMTYAMLSLMEGA